MRIFIIHKGQDYSQVLLLKEKLESISHVDILALESDSKFKTWKSEAKYKIKICDLVLYVLGENTSKSTNVDFEINAEDLDTLMFQTMDHNKTLWGHGVEEPLFVIKNLHISAYSEDGYVEAIELKDKKFCSPVLKGNSVRSFPINSLFER